MKNRKRIGLVFALAIVISLFTMPHVFAEDPGDWGTLQNRINQGEKITLGTDYTAGEDDDALSVPQNVDITIDLNGHTIDRDLAEASDDVDDCVIIVEGHLTIEDSKGGGTITGGHGLKIAGGIYVDGGILTMDGGTITGNKVASEGIGSDSYGGGVYLSNGGFVMNGGAITGNQASSTSSTNCNSYGGGVYIDRDSFFEMNKGTISGNTADYGGGIAVDDSSNGCTLAGGTISGNTAAYGGGGVFSVDDFTMKGGTVSKNQAERYGGGVCIDNNNDTFYMEGGIISGNSAHRAGGVLVRNGSLEMSDGEISGNEADGGDQYATGGGVYLESCDFEMTNGTISGNSAYAEGGGVYLDECRFTMTNGVISDNSADSKSSSKSSYGGGMCLKDSLFEMRSGTISDNSTNGEGGGMYLDDSQLTMTGGTISQNTAYEGGGVYYHGSIVDYFILSAGTISNNHADENGGGVNIGTGNFELSGGTISGNDAAGDDYDGHGGGIYFYNGQFYLSGNPVISGNKHGDADDNVCVTDQTRIDIDGKLENTTKIGITMVEPGVFTVGYPDMMGSADPKRFFKTDKAGFGIKIYDGPDQANEGEVMLTPVQTFTVTFVDGLGNTLRQEIVEEGDAAVGPDAPTRSGYVFGGWDKNISKVMSDMTVAAVWKISIDKAPVALSSAALTYNGKVLKPAIKTVGDKALKAGTDYAAAWSNASSKSIGSYTVTITGKGEYTGTTKASYQILPKGTRIKKLKKAKKAVTVTWKKQAAKMPKKRITGYQIQLATDKQFAKNKKTVTVKGYKKVSKKVKRLKGGRKYFVRIRTYQSVSGAKYYSAWSKVKSVKTRK